MGSLVIAICHLQNEGAGILQDRIGPNRAGPFGLLQPVADGVKLFMKEESFPLLRQVAVYFRSMPCHDHCDDDGAVIPTRNKVGYLDNG
jgi:NADH:ubiquinone oxidoreductase subunit H